jgi:hypothetical protein
MGSSTNKKVLEARFDRETLAGFVQAPGGFGAEGLELLTPEGTVANVPYAEIKAVCFVRDFSDGERWRQHRAFATRPKSQGLWLRLLFRDHDSIEGVVSNNLMLLEPAGFSIVPPDPSFQNQKIFVPRAALAEVQVLSVVGSPLRRQARKAPERTKDQIGLFDAS